MARSTKRCAPLGPTIQSKPDFCPLCDGRQIIKRGLRKNSFRQLQIYFCRDCGRYFSSLAGLKGVKYPPRVIARALCLYNLGHSQEEAARRIASEHRIAHGHIAFRQSYDVGILIGCFRSSIPSPPIPLFTLR
jgi:hypothetical protein